MTVKYRGKEGKTQREKEGEQQTRARAIREYLTS